MAVALGDLDTLPTCRAYIQMALTVGLEHFGKQGEELICMNMTGVEIGRFKSQREAAAKLGIDRRDIQHLLKGRGHSLKGMKFRLATDELPKKEIA